MAVLVLAGAVFLSACAQPLPDHTYWEQVITAKGRILHIDKEARRVKVRVGLRTLNLIIDEDGPDLNEHFVGEKLDIHYYEAVVVAILKSEGPEVVDVTRYRLSPATEERPAVALVKARQFSAEFVSYDYQANIATFETDAGSYPFLIVPIKLQSIVKALQPGDRVKVSVEQAIAVRLADPKTSGRPSPE